MFCFLLSGCEKEEPITYYIPKEERSENRPTQPTAAPAVVDPVTTSSSQGSSMQVLPGMKEAAEKAGEITYQVPESWIELPPGSVRKASFRINSENGGAEVAVTAFPGNVGGLTANVNRWCEQIGRATMTEQQVAEAAKPYIISNHNGLLVFLQGESESILGGILDFHGYTWFFKMKGDNVTVVQETEAMQKFLDSVALLDDHH
ncbi:MAG: hypothetical protein AAGH40_11165 [Verrucomicrobiota bacterium]